MLNRRQFTAALAGIAAASTFGFGSANAQTAQSSLERVKASGVLRIGGVPDGLPYYQKSISDGSWRGFNYDIAKKLAGDLGLKLDVLETTWGNSVLDLQAGKIDVFFGLNRTPEREKAIDFSVPVIKNAFSLIVRKGMTVKTWEDINKPEIRVAVDAGSSHDSAVTRFTPNATILRLKSQSDATAALQAGRADVQCLVVMLALGLKGKNPSVGDLVVPEPRHATDSNGGFRREDDKSWQNFVNSWIQEHRDNGFITKTVAANMALVGVKNSDIPEGMTF